MSNFRHLGFLVLCFAASTTASGHNVRFYFASGDRAGSLCLQTDVGKLKDVRECRKKGPIFKVDGRTKRSLQNASNLIPILSSADGLGKWAVLLSRVRSNPRSPKGFCGAGYEDSVLLMRLENGLLKLTDQLLLQSCKKSLSLESDGNESPVDALAIDHANTIISFRWTSDSEGLLRLIKIINGRFRVESIVGKTETDTN